MMAEENSQQSANANDLVVAKVDGLTDDLNDVKQDLTVVKNDVGVLVAASNDNGGSDIDYSGQLTQLGQVLVITDVLLLVLMAIVFLNAGMTLGNSVVKWFKHDD